MKKGIFWFRNDLRIMDHPALLHALSQVDELIPLFIFEDRIWKAELPKRINLYRSRFLLESLKDLQISLENLGGQILVKSGDPQVIVPTLAEKHKADCCFVEAAHAHEETTVEKQISNVIKLKAVEGSTLLHPDDLPFSLDDLPGVFTKFRKKLESSLHIRPPYPLASSGNFWKGKKAQLPTLDKLNLSAAPADSQSSFLFTGGETSAWERLQSWFWEKRAVSKYKGTRNQLLGSDFSSRFSPWLAHGCISARSIYYELKNYEEKHGANSSTYWLFFELLWRDFFSFIARTLGPKLFQKQGIKTDTENSADCPPNPDSFQNWKNGKTTDPFVNANMNELRRTGWMSNRGRQNVASYLIHDLGLDWRRGAEWFEENLIDYDPCSNYGNWLYLSGFGNDPRPDRKFNTKKQAEIYDPDGQYRKVWNEW
jgi:deoxyribodipyrimidine photo-lyase